MNADTGLLGSKKAQKNLLTNEASYKCPSSSAVARHFFPILQRDMRARTGRGWSLVIAND
jgi:hypothetical protein